MIGIRQMMICLLELQTIIVFIGYFLMDHISEQ